MDNFTFGVTLLVLGFGGTLITLGLFSLIMAGLRSVFPYRAEDEEKKRPN